MTMEDALLEHIRTTVLRQQRGERVERDTPLIERGILDSMGLTEIVAFLEERAGVRVPDEEVTPENFETIGAIARLVERLERGRA